MGKDFKFHGKSDWLGLGYITGHWPKESGRILVGRIYFPKENHDAITNNRGMVAVQLEMSDAYRTTEDELGRTIF